MSIYFNSASTYGPSNFLVGSLVDGAPYQTIGDAIAAISSGDTLLIQPGTYNESIAWPAGISVQGVSSSISNSAVTIIGNQTFAGGGNLSFSGIFFQSSSGDTFVSASASGTSQVTFSQCNVSATAGRCVVSSSSSTMNQIFNTCQLLSTSSDAMSVGGGHTQFIATFATSTAGNGLTITTNGLVSSQISTFAGSAYAVYLSTSSSVYSGYENRLQAPTGIFLNATGASATSVRETYSGSGTYFADTSTSATLLSVGLPLFISGGTTPNPSIITTIIPGLASVPYFAWNSISANQSLVAGNGYFVASGALSLALPASSSVGDTIAVSLTDAGTSWILTQAAGQKIRVGNTPSTIGVGGSVASTASGDTITMVSYASGLWEATSVVGELTVS